MAAKDYGNKHTCAKCGARFYDMRKPEPACPRCGANVTEPPIPAAERRRNRLAAVPKIIEQIAAPVSDDDEEIEEEEEES